MHNVLRKIAGVVATALVITTLIPAFATNAADKVAKLALQTAQSGKEEITEIEMGLNDTVDLKFYGVPDYRDTGIGWTVSDSSVATVSKAGVITPKKVGVTQVIYKAMGYSAVPVKITVKKDAELKVVYANDELNKLPEVSIADQKTKQVYTEYTFAEIGAEKDFCFVGAKGYNSSVHKCKWSSSDTTVATVDKAGVVTSVGCGEAVISLTIEKNGKSAYDVIPMTVTVQVEEKFDELKVTDVTENSFVIVLPKNTDATQVTFAFDPALSVKSLTYNTSADSSSVTVTVSNTVEAGKAYRVDAKLDGKVFAKGEILREVKETVATPTPTPTESVLQVRIGNADDTFDKALKSTTISTSDYAEKYIFVRFVNKADGKTYTVSPSDAGYTSVGRVTFTTSNENVLGIYEDGMLEARTQGTAVIGIYFIASDSSNSTLLGTVSVSVVGDRRLASVEFKEAENGWQANKTSAKLLSEGYLIGYNELNLTYVIKDQLGDVFVPENAEITAAYKGKDVSDFFSALEIDTDGNVYVAVDHSQFDEDGQKAYDVTLTLKFMDGNTTKAQSYRVTVYNVRWLIAHKQDTRTYSIMWLSDVNNLGLIGNEDTDELYGEVALVVNFDGIPVGISGTDGNYETIKAQNLTGDAAEAVRGNYYISIKRDSTQLTEFMQTATGPAITVTVNNYVPTDDDTYRFSLRKAFSELSDGDFDEDAKALAKIKNVNVVVKVYEATVVNNALSFKSIATLTKTLSNTDTATASVVVNNTKVDWLPDDWTAWLEENAVTTIKIGDETTVVSTLGGFADEGIIAEVVRYSDTSNYVPSVNIYIPVGSGYICKNVPISKTLTVLNK